MADVPPDAEPPRPVRFTGERSGLFVTLLRGFLLFVPTLGLYRFWLVTQKRRFYWANTEIDGDALEYTGTANQLLVGFLIAVVIFVPLYAFLFYLGTQAEDVASTGYAVLLLVLYLLGSYAAFRARRFRLTRTLWRGIRFRLTGNPWIFALMNLGWTLVTLVTLGLTYPFMAASLWRYQTNHTWYGDRQFAFAGSWRTIAGPYFRAYFTVIALIVAGIVALAASGGFESVDAKQIGALIGRYAIVLVVILYLAFLYVSARFFSRLMSATRIGRTEIATHVRLRWLVLQHISYALMLTFVASLFFGVGVFIFLQMAGINLQTLSESADDVGRLLQLTTLDFAVLIGIYLAFLASWSVVGELFLAVGFWKLAAKGTAITNADDLKSVRAAGGESALAGEGLADALNVGAY